MSQFQVFHRGPVLALVLCLLSVLPATAQRIKLLQLEQKGTPKEGYFGLTNSAGDQVYTEFNGAVTTIITANGHWYLNGSDDAYGSTTISPGETVAFTGNDGSFRGIVAGLTANGSNVIFIDGRALQWNLGANGSYTTIGDVQGSSESVNFVGAGSVTTSRSGNTITITGSSSLSGSGTTNYVTKWTSSTTLGNSAIQDNGSTVSIGGALDASYELFIADGHIKIGDVAGEFNKIMFGDGTFVYVGEGGVDDRLYLRGTTLSIDINGSLGTNGYVLTSNGTTASWQPVSTAATDLTFTGASSPYTLNSSTGTDVTFASGGIVSLSRSVNQLTISATEVDGSTSNELDTWDLGANASYTTISNAEQVNFVGAGIASTSRSTNTITITATEVDGSVTNEAQTWSNSGTTSYTGTLSTAGGAGGGSFTIAAGSNVTVSHSAGTVTISSTAGATDLTFTGASSPYTLNSSTGTDVTFASGGIVSLSRSTNELTISATEVDGSVTNEAQSWSNSGTTSYTGTLSTAGGAGGGSFTIAAGSNVSVSHSTGTVTIAASFTEVDGSTSNELDTWDLGANASYTTISNGEQVNFVGAGIASTSRSTNTITITATEVDGSVTNEAQTWSNSGTTSYTGTLSTAGGAGGGSFTIAAGSNVTVSHSAGTVTIAASAGATDLSVVDNGAYVTVTSSTGSDFYINENTGYTLLADGLNLTFTLSDNSATNEAQSLSHGGGGSSYTGVLSTVSGSGGGSFTLQGGSGVTLSHNLSGTVIFNATDVSATNESQSWSNSGTTSYTGTLSTAGGAGGGSFTIAAGSNVTVSHSAGTVTIASTAGATDLTFTGASSPYTLNSSTGTDVTFASGGIVSLSRSVNQLTISATEVDGSTSNELQDLFVTDNGISGANIEITSGIAAQIFESGIAQIDGSAGYVLVDVPGTDLTFSGASVPFTLTSSTGTDVTFTSGGIVSISRSTNELTISATEVDGSVTNEAQTWSNSGTTSYTGTLSTAGGSGGGSFTIAAGSNVTVSHSAGTVTIASTAGATDLTFTGASSPYTLNSSTGTDVTFASGNNIILSRSSNQLTVAQPAFTDLATGFTSGYVIYVDGSGTPHTETGFSYNDGGNILSVGYIITAGIDINGIDGSATLGENRWLTKNSGSDAIGWNYKTSGYYTTKSGGTAISAGDSFIRITGSGTYNMPPGGASDERHMIAIFNDSGGNITLSRINTGLIDGATTKTVADQTLLICVSIGGSNVDEWITK